MYTYIHVCANNVIYMCITRKSTCTYRQIFTHLQWWRTPLLELSRGSLAIKALERNTFFWCKIATQKWAGVPAAVFRAWNLHDFFLVVKSCRYVLCSDWSTSDFAVYYRLFLAPFMLCSLQSLPLVTNEMCLWREAGAFRQDSWLSIFTERFRTTALWSVVPQSSLILSSGNAALQRSLNRWVKSGCRSLQWQGLIFFNRRVEFWTSRCVG